MNFDRGFIKWAPFNSVISNKTVLKEIDTKKIEKPLLSKDQVEELNELIIEAYYSKSKVIISFYEQNQIKNISTIITKINTTNNLIELENKKLITFNQIIKIKNY